MTIDPADIFVGVGTALMTVTGLELGYAFLMRAGRESVGESND